METKQQKLVTIYSTPTCVYCRMAKDFFKEHSISYTEHNVAVDAGQREYMFKRTGQMGVPVIEIGNEVIIGFDEERISDLLGLHS